MTDTHVQYDFDAYLHGDLDVVERCRLEQHLKACPECLERLKYAFLRHTGGEQGLLASLQQELQLGECLHPDTVAAYVDGDLTAEEVQRANQHIDACVDCFEMVWEYWQYRRAAPAIVLNCPGSPEALLFSHLATAYETDAEVKQFAADADSEAFPSEHMVAIEDDAGTTRAVFELDEEDDLRITLLDYDAALIGKTVLLTIPELGCASEAYVLTGDPVEFYFGQVILPPTGIPEIRITVVDLV